MFDYIKSRSHTGRQTFPLLLRFPRLGADKDGTAAACSSNIACPALPAADTTCVYLHV